MKRKMCMYLAMPFASLKAQNGMKSVRLGRFFCMPELQRYSVHYKSHGREWAAFITG